MKTITITRAAYEQLEAWNEQHGGFPQLDGAVEVPEGMQIQVDDEAALALGMIDPDPSVAIDILVRVGAHKQ